jgi:hypothetical protein
MVMPPEETNALMDALAADPGAHEALNRCMAKGSDGGADLADERKGS